MSDYIVSTEIEVSADSAEEAARMGIDLLHSLAGRALANFDTIEVSTRLITKRGRFSLAADDPELHEVGQQSPEDAALEEEDARDADAAYADRHCPICGHLAHADRAERACAECSCQAA